MDGWTDRWTDGWINKIETLAGTIDQWVHQGYGYTDE